MKHAVYFFFAFFFLICINPVKAQNFSLRGQIAGKAGEPLFGANIALLRIPDSALVTGTTSDTAGFFRIENISHTKILLRISYLGYEDAFLKKEFTGNFLWLGKITLLQKAEMLEEINITGTIEPAQIKGDTTQYNAGAFKTAADASGEDLITKMPGITIQDGKVQAQGEEVKQVTVDGKQFFGDDANAVLKNLPSEIIDKIQVFDQKSEQSRFTGFDDGNTSKTINVVTKTQFRNGTFGKVYGGYGYNDKWRGGTSMNFFKDKRRITILANANNVNEQNFSSEDLLGVMSGSGGSGRGHGGSGRSPRGGTQSWRQQGNESNFLVNQKNGITTTRAFGINYSDQWKDVEFTGSYFFNNSFNVSESGLFRQYITSGTEGLTYTEKLDNLNYNINHRFNSKIDWKPDADNSVTFQPKVSLQQNDGRNSVEAENALGNIPLSRSDNTYRAQFSGINFSSPLLYRHAFNKKGETFSVNITPAFNRNSGDTRLESHTDFFSDTVSTDSLNQSGNSLAEGVSLSTNMVYTEPLSAQSRLMFSYNNNFNRNNSAKETFNFPYGSDGLALFDTTLSNKFNSEYFSNSVGMSYRFHSENWNMMAGASHQVAELKNEQVFPYSYHLQKRFNNLLPTAMLQYKFTKNKNLRFYYRSGNNVPSVSQMQEVINISNPLQLTSGNSALKQDRQNFGVLRYSSVDAQKNTSLFLLLGGTFTNNYAANSVFIAQEDTLIAPGIVLSSGSSISKPVNLNGHYSVRSFANYSFPVQKIKSNLNFNIGGNFSNTPGLVNEALNEARNLSVSVGTALSSNISELFDFTVSSNTSHNSIANSLQKSLNSVFYSQNSKLKLQAQPWKGLVLQMDLNHQYFTGLSESFNRNFVLWNVAIGYKFLKNRQADLRLSVFDILKQNNSIVRNTAESYYEDVQTNVLQRYAMVTFTYNLKQYGKQGEK